MLQIASVSYMFIVMTTNTLYTLNINGGDVQRKNVVNNVDKSSLWAP